MKPRPSSGRRPGPGPLEFLVEFLVDRSLSQVLLPAMLRQAGLTVHTLSDVFGEAAAPEIKDAEWIAAAAQRGWVVLTKDDHIRRRPAERQAIANGEVRVFCLTNAGLTFAGQAGYFVTNRSRILQASRQPGPYLYGVYQGRILKLWPTES